MRLLRIMLVVIATACAPSTYVEEADVPTEPARVTGGSVTRWLIATTGDEPASCDERLATDGLGPDDVALGIPLEIVHLNEMQGMRLVALSYAVDGQCTFSWSHDSTTTDSVPNQLNVMNAELASGDHEIGLVAEYGPSMATSSGYDYRVKVRGAYVVALDSATRLFVTSYEKGTIATPVEKRAALRFELGVLESPPVLLRKRR